MTSQEAALLALVRDCSAPTPPASLVEAEIALHIRVDPHDVLSLLTRLTLRGLIRRRAVLIWRGPQVGHVLGWAVTLTPAGRAALLQEVTPCAP